MSEQTTPETDALDCELHTPRVLQDRYSEMRDHAQKLERERDEVRDQRDRLAALAKQFLNILDITEESINGRLFHPTNITSCRAGDLQKIGELVEAIRRASNP